MNSTKSNGLTSPQSQPAKSLNKCPAIFSPISPERNEFADVANKFASRGHDLSRIDDEPPRYYISRHGRALMVHSWMAVKTLLVHIGRSA
jgi:hypothetical protein